MTVKRTTLVLLILVTTALFGWGMGVGAQNTSPIAPPAIYDFYSDLSGITLAEAEAGQTTANLSWHVLNMTADYDLQLESYVLNDWTSLLTAEDILPDFGIREIMVQHPLTFSPPTYRLSILNSDAAIVDQRVLSIPYLSRCELLEQGAEQNGDETTPEPSPEVTTEPCEETPQIDSFTTTVTTVDANALTQRSAQVAVAWSVSNRLPSLNLVFEQVMDDGSAVSVEYPRPTLWVSSVGQGAVAPMLPQSGTQVRLRLRLVDVLSGEMEDEAEVTVDVTGTVSQQPTNGNTNGGNSGGSTAVSNPPAYCATRSPLDVPRVGAPNDGCSLYRDPTGRETRVSATVSPQIVALGSGMTVSWNVSGAEMAIVEWYDTGTIVAGQTPATIQLFENQALSGSLWFLVPPNFTGNARIVVWAANRASGSPVAMYQRLAYAIVDVPVQRAGPVAGGITFNVSPNPINATSPFTLTWDATGVSRAASVIVAWVDRNSNFVQRTGLPLSGSLNLNISEVAVSGTDVSFSAYPVDVNGQMILNNEAIAISSDITVPVANSLRIDSFTANPNPAARGGQVTLSWSVANAVSAGITLVTPEGIFTESGAQSNLPASGSVTLTIPQEYTTSITYYLGAVDAYGISISDFVQVSITCPYTSTLAPFCPQSQQTINVAYQSFQGGYMVWRGDTREIIVLYSDGSYAIFPDTWVEGEAINITQTPPSGLIAPQRGFGKLWAAQSDIQTRLGWATASETSYSTTFEETRESLGRYPTTGYYFRLPSGSVVHLTGYPLGWVIQ